MTLVVENKHNSKHMGFGTPGIRVKHHHKPRQMNQSLIGVVGGIRGGRKPGLKGVVVSSEQETIEATSQWQPKSQSSQVAVAAPPTAQGSATTTTTTTATVRGNGGQQRVNKKAPRKEYPQAELSDASHQEKVEERFSGPRQSRYGGGQNQRVQQQDNSKQQQLKYDAQYQYHQKAGGRSNNNGNEPQPPSPNESLFDQGPPRGTGLEDKLSHGVEEIHMQQSARGNNNINRDQ